MMAMAMSLDLQCRMKGISQIVDLHEATRMLPERSFRCEVTLAVEAVRMYSAVAVMSLQTMVGAEQPAAISAVRGMDFTVAIMLMQGTVGYKDPFAFCAVGMGSVVAIVLSSKDSLARSTVDMLCAVAVVLVQRRARYEATFAGIAVGMIFFVALVPRKTTLRLTPTTTVTAIKHQRSSYSTKPRDSVMASKAPLYCENHSEPARPLEQTKPEGA